MERLLWVVYAGTLLSGILGLALQHIVPRMLSQHLGEEIPLERIPQACRQWTRHADRLFEEMAQLVATPVLVGPAVAEETPEAADWEQVRDMYERLVRPFLGEKYGWSSPLARPLEAEALLGRMAALPGLEGIRPQLGEFAQLCQERRRLHDQVRLHWLLHGWLLIHVPLALALVVIGLGHAVVSLFY